jgi:electron-transferring-flavoprotein dehydrogenase
MKSGMLAAVAAFAAIAAGRSGDVLADYPETLKRSFVWRELKAVRNIRPALNWGLLPGTLYGGLDMWFHALGLGALIPWTLQPRVDHLSLKKAAECRPISYPRPDGVITFDRLSSVFLSNTNHEEDQPSHLHIKDPAIPVAVNLARYAGPEARYCPAAVYEFPDDGPGGAPRLQVNAQNCIHCKTCDIKDPTQNIDWTVPEGGGGPNYPNM